MRITQVWARDQRNRDWLVPPSNACSAGDALRVESAEITARLVNMSCGERAVREMNRDQRTNLRDFMGWRCGSCNQLITRVDNGWVEWLASEGDRGESSLGGLRLVHRGAPFANGLEGSCQDDARKEFRNNRTIVEGLSLERLVGRMGSWCCCRY